MKKLPASVSVFSREFIEMARSSGMSPIEYDYWTTKQQTAKARAEAKAKIADKFEAPNRGTPMLDRLGLRNFQGLPPNIRSRLLVLAYYETAKGVWAKLRRLVEPMILANYTPTVNTEAFKILVGQEPKKIQPTMILLEADDGEKDYISGTILRLPSKYDTYDSLSLSTGPRRSDYEQSSYILDVTKPKDDTEAYIIKLVNWIHDRDRTRKLYDLITESDGVPSLPEELELQHHQPRPRK
mgnify:FL=1